MELVAGIAIFLGLAAVIIIATLPAGDPYDPCQFPDLCRREEDE